LDGFSEECQFSQPGQAKSAKNEINHFCVMTSGICTLHHFHTGVLKILFHYFLSGA